MPYNDESQQFNQITKQVANDEVYFKMLCLLHIYRLEENIFWPRKKKKAHISEENNLNFNHI